MIEVLATALVVVAFAAAVWSLVLMVLNHPISLATKPTLGLAVVVLVLEAGLLVQLVAGVVAVFGDRPLDRPTFIGYLIGAALVLPLGGLWAVAERSRWGAGVLIVACVSVPAMILRLNQLWAGHG